MVRPRTRRTVANSRCVQVGQIVPIDLQSSLAVKWERWLMIKVRLRLRTKFMFTWQVGLFSAGNQSWQETSHIQGILRSPRGAPSPTPWHLARLWPFQKKFEALGTGSSKVFRKNRSCHSSTPKCPRFFFFFSLSLYPVPSPHKHILQAEARLLIQPLWEAVYLYSLRQ